MLDVQALGSEKQLPVQFIIVAINSRWTFLQKLGIETESSSSLFPLHDKSRLLHSTNITACIYNQVSNTIIKDLGTNLDDYPGLKCVGIALKQEYQA